MIYIAYHILICGLSKHSTKGHVRGQGCQEDVGNGGNALNVDGVSEVRREEGYFPFDVFVQTLEWSVDTKIRHSSTPAQNVHKVSFNTVLIQACSFVVKYNLNK